MIDLQQLSATVQGEYLAYYKGYKIIWVNYEKDPNNNIKGRWVAAQSGREDIYSTVSLSKSLLDDQPDQLRSLSIFKQQCHEALIELITLENKKYWEEKIKE